MNAEVRLLCICTRQSINADLMEELRDICQTRQIDWLNLFELADAHLIAPLIYVNLQRCIKQFDIPIPDEVFSRFKSAAIENTIVDQQRRAMLGQVINYFAEQNIDVMFVKGIALDELVYRETWYTAPQDVDLLLRPPRSAFDQEQRAMIAGFEGFGIECDGFAHHDVTMNGTLPVDFRRIWDDAHQINWHEHTLFVMAPEDMLISLCINSCRKRFFRLKAMCDIAETLATYPNLNWPLFLEKVRAYEVTAIVFAALLTTDERLGIDVPHGLFDELELNPLRAKLIRYLCQITPLTESVELRTGEGNQLFQRRISRGVALRYATLQGYQLLRHLHFVARTPQAKFEFWSDQ